MWPFLTEMTGSHKRTRHVVEDDFCIFLGIFRHLQKIRVLFGETPKKEGPSVHVIRTLSFFRWKSDVFEMRKTKKFHLLGPCQHEGPIWWKMLSLSWKNVHFWSNVMNKIRPWVAQVTFQADLWSDVAVARPLTIRNVKNTWPAVSSSLSLLPSPFSPTSFLSSWPPKTLQFPGKKTKLMLMMSTFDTTRGSYSLGGVLLRRNTLYNSFGQIETKKRFNPLSHIQFFESCWKKVQSFESYSILWVMLKKGSVLWVVFLKKIHSLIQKNVSILWVICWKEGSILWVKKKVQFFELYFLTEKKRFNSLRQTKQRVQFIESCKREGSIL